MKRLSTIRRAILVTILLVGTACSLTLPQRMQQWVGAPADQLVSDWGKPSTRSQLSDGREILVWNRPWVDYYGDQRVCVQSFTVAPNGTVESYDYAHC